MEKGEKNTQKLTLKPPTKNTHTHPTNMTIVQYPKSCYKI